MGLINQLNKNDQNLCLSQWRAPSRHREDCLGVVDTWLKEQSLIYKLSTAMENDLRFLGSWDYSTSSYQGTHEINIFSLYCNKEPIPLSIDPWQALCLISL